MMLAEISTGEQWMVGCTIVMTLVSLGSLAVMFFKKTDMEVSPQPLIVAMEKEFTSRRDFDQHVKNNHRDHENLFSKIGGVERGAAGAIEQKVEVVRRDLVQIGNQVSGLQSETKLQNQQLARMDSKLDRLAERPS